MLIVTKKERVRSNQAIGEVPQPGKPEKIKTFPGDGQGHSSGDKAI